MNKPKRQMTRQTKKKITKEVRAAAPSIVSSLKSDQLTPEMMLSTYPEKVQKKEKAALNAFDKNMKVRKTKAKATHSKRTTPGTVNKKTAPQVVHVEGKRWIDTLKKQVQSTKKIASRQSTKTTKKKGK
jgi:hypothetical protein